MRIFARQPTVLISSKETMSTNGALDPELYNPDQCRFHRQNPTCRRIDVKAPVASSSIIRLPIGSKFQQGGCPLTRLRYRKRLRQKRMARNQRVRAVRAVPKCGLRSDRRIFGFARATMQIDAARPNDGEDKTPDNKAVCE